MMMTQDDHLPLEGDDERPADDAGSSKKNLSESEADSGADSRVDSDSGLEKVTAPDGSTIELEPLVSIVGGIETEGLDPELQVDECPKCGAATEDRTAIMCLRCGYNFQTKSFSIDAASANDSDDDDGDDEDASDDRGSSLDEPKFTGPISADGRGNVVLPAVIAAGCALGLLAGLAMGDKGLIPVSVGENGETVDSVGWFDRFTWVIRMVVLVGMWMVSGVLGISALGKIRQRPRGDLALGGVRVLAIILMMRIMTFLNFDSHGLEWMAEVVLQVPIALLGVFMFFRVSIREAIECMMYASVVFVIVWASAYVIVFASHPQAVLPG